MGDTEDQFQQGLRDVERKLREEQHVVNQCQGCQAGWPLVESKLHLTGKERMYHKVVGGYPNESVGCTKHLYE